jgi:hypothetical protein
MSTINSQIRKTLVAICILFTTVTVLAQHPKLLGQWKSDRELTMAFAKDYSQLPNKTTLFLEQLMGQMTMTFTKSTIFSYMPDSQSVTSEGVKSQLVGFKEKHPYRVLATTKTQIAILGSEPVTNLQTITVYNFENDDTMWVYLGGRNFSNLNIREYFRRTQ